MSAGDARRYRRWRATPPAGARAPPRAPGDSDVLTELVPHERGAVFVISPVEEDHVQMRMSRMSPDVRCTTVTAPLLTAPHAPRRAARGALCVEPLHALDEEAGRHAEQRPVLGAPAPPLGFWRGTAVSWAGMMAGAGLGYLLGARAGAPALQRMVGASELARLTRAAERHGPWFLLLFRGVPVLSEASVVFAGAGRMPLRAFFTVTALAHLGISATYAAVGASAARLTSVLLLFAGIVLLPGLALPVVRSPEWRRRAAQRRGASG